MSHGMTDEEVRQWVARSRGTQGLPPTVTDPAILARVVTLAFAGQPASSEQQAGGNGRPAP